MADGERWQAPDLTAKERADLEAIDSIDWISDDEPFKREWAAMLADDEWYEKRKTSWGIKAKAKRPAKKKGDVPCLSM